MREVLEESTVLVPHPLPGPPGGRGAGVGVVQGQILDFSLIGALESISRANFR